MARQSRGKKLRPVGKKKRAGSRDKQAPQGDLYEYEETKEAESLDREMKSQYKESLIDSDNNEFVDEEIDEDLAFTPDDYALYGDVGSSTGRKGKKEHLKKKGANMEESPQRVDDEFLSLVVAHDDSEDEFEDEPEDSNATFTEAEKVRHALGTLPAPAQTYSAKRSRIHVKTEQSKENYLGRDIESSTLSLDALVGQGQGSGKLEAVPKRRLERLKRTEMKAKLNVSLPRSEQARINRRVDYALAKEDASKWQAIVKKNREADHLSFPLQVNSLPQNTSSSLIDKFQSTTDLEKDVEDVLRQAGVDEKQIKEFEDLELRKLTKEEVEKRKAEVAKMKSLLFHFELKQKRAAKIKSRKFHKIQKKAKERQRLTLGELQKIDPEKAREEILKAEMKRAEERASLRHKQSGQWISKTLKRGQIPQGTREAINEQIRMGDMLTQRMNSINSSSEDDAGKSECESEENNLWSEESISALREESLPQKGLLGMPFMQKHLERQRQEALDALEAMKKDEDQMASDGSNSVFSLHGRYTFAGTDGKGFEGGEACRAQSAVKFDAADVQIPEVHTSSSVSMRTESLLLPTIDDNRANDNDSGEEAELIVPSNSRNADMGSRHSRDADMGPRQSAIRTCASPRSNGESTVERVSPQISPSLEENVLGEGATKKNGSVSDREGLTQEELIRRAFGGDLDAEESFYREKKQISSSGNSQYEKALPGWGAWTGGGIQERQRFLKKDKKGKRCQEKDPKDRKDANLSHVIISEKKDKKSAIFSIPSAPHPFTSKEQFEKTMRTPLGADWSTLSHARKAVRPALKTMAGVNIDPLKMGKRTSKQKETEVLAKKRKLKFNP